MNKPNPDESAKTLAQLIFKDKQLLVERPSEMPFDLYRALLKIQSRILKDLFRRCPDRKLQGLISRPQPTIRITPGFKKTHSTRKAS